MTLPPVSTSDYADFEKKKRDRRFDLAIEAADRYERLRGAIDEGEQKVSDATSQSRFQLGPLSVPNPLAGVQTPWGQPDQPPTPPPGVEPAAPTPAPTPAPEPAPTPAPSPTPAATPAPSPTEEEPWFKRLQAVIAGPAAPPSPPTAAPTPGPGRPPAYQATPTTVALGQGQEAGRDVDLGTN